MKKAAIVLLLVACQSLHAKIFLLLDEDLRQSSLEKVIYSFVPMTNASEVELFYVKDFIRSGAANAFASKLGAEDRGIYIGAEHWPTNSYIDKVANTPEWSALVEKITFFVLNDGPDYAQMPRGLFPREQLWKKYAELTQSKHAGYIKTHYLDARPFELSAGTWRGITCVNAAGKQLRAGYHSPIILDKKQLRFSYRYTWQIDYIGRLVCINAPASDAIVEINVMRTDVKLEAQSGKFSVWNEARPLTIKIDSAWQISAPLELKIIPEINENPVEFFFQGDRISCYENRCKKKQARFLLPALRESQGEFEIAIRGTGDDYFRGAIKLMAGEVEVAHAAMRFTPHSWVSETIYALRNPSEYKSAFFMYLVFILLLATLIIIMIFFIRRAYAALQARRKPVASRQTSAEVAIERKNYIITASKNPFGCNLVDFGGILSLEIGESGSRLTQGGVKHEFVGIEFTHRLSDGYVIGLRRDTGGQLLLSAYCVNGKGLSAT